MPMMPIEPLFCVSAVPGDVASAIGGAVGAGAYAMWRRITFLTDQSRLDQIAHTEAVMEALEARHRRELAARESQIERLKLGTG